MSLIVLVDYLSLEGLSGNYGRVTDPSPVPAKRVKKRSDLESRQLIPAVSLTDGSSNVGLLPANLSF